MITSTAASWTQDEAIAYESACECIMHLAGIYTEQIHAARSEVPLNQALIDALRARRAALVQERYALHVQDAMQVARIRSVYGVQVRAHNEIARTGELEP